MSDNDKTLSGYNQNVWVARTSVCDYCDDTESILGQCDNVAFDHCKYCCDQDKCKEEA